MNLKRAQEAAAQSFLIAQSSPSRRFEARTYLEQAIQLAPNSWKIWNNAGVVHQQLGALTEAALSLGRAAALAPGKPDPHHNLGALAARRNKPYVAIRALSRAARMQPTNAEIWLTLADVLVLHRRNHARASFRRGASLHGWPALAAMRFHGGKHRLHQLIGEESYQLGTMAIPATLMRFIRYTRFLENSTKWVEARWLDCVRSQHFFDSKIAASCDDYGAHFFTKGSFLKVLRAGTFRYFAINSAKGIGPSGGRANQKAVVLGSGLGEQCAFILAVLPNVVAECLGYERTCVSMANVANRITAKAGAIGQLQFVCTDARNADLTGAGLLIVNNNGWPDAITGTILRNAASQLPNGAVMAIHRWPSGSKIPAFIGTAFRKTEQIFVETSWRKDAPISIYIRQS